MSLLGPAAAALSPSIIREMSRRKGPDTLDLTLGQPARAPDPDLLDRALEALRAGPPGYTENAGLPELRAALAAHHGRAPEEVVVTVGSEQAVYLALTAALSPGDEVLVPDPGYPAYPGIVRLLGGVPVPYPVPAATGRVPELDALEARVGPRTRVVIWNAPSNPFGVVPRRSVTERLVELCQRRGIAVLSDEIYRDLRYDGAPFTSPADLDPEGFLVGGLSKSCALTGFRLGWLIAPPAFVAQATLAHQLMVTCAPRLSQLVALEVFREPSRLTAHLPDYARARAALAEARDALPPEVELRLGQGAFYAVLELAGARLPEGGAMALALEALRAVDVAVVPGAAFGPDDRFWRLSYAAGAEVAEAGLRRLGAFLTDRR